MPNAVEELDTPENNPGINPDADVNVNIDPSIVVAVKLPGTAIYNPCAVNGI